MDQLLQLDLALLGKVNAGWAHPALDTLAAWLTPLGSMPLMVFYVLVWIAVARPSGYYSLLAALAIFIQNRVFKFLIARDRPFWSLEVRLPLPVDHLADGSFPSGHALATFTMALLLGHFFPRLRWPALFLAALVSLSRVYIGVHYPLDVLTGAMLGGCTAWGVARVCFRFAGGKTN